MWCVVATSEPVRALLRDAAARGRKEIDDLHPCGELRGLLMALEPLDEHHALELAHMAQEAKVWAEPRPHVTPSEMVRYVERAVTLQRAGTLQAFAISDLERGTVGVVQLGMSRRRRSFVQLAEAWVAAKLRHAGVALEARYMVIRLAFETLEYRQVGLWPCILEQDSWIRAHSEVSRSFAEVCVPELQRSDPDPLALTAADWPKLRIAMECRLGRVLQAQLARDHG